MKGRADEAARQGKIQVGILSILQLELPQISRLANFMTMIKPAQADTHNANMRAYKYRHEIKINAAAMLL